MKYLSVPIFLFGVAGVAVSARGLSSDWGTTTGYRIPFWAAALLGAAVHYSWMVCTANGRLSAAPIWLFSLLLTRAGLRDFGFATPLAGGLAIEGIPLASCLTLAGPWETHLEHWRLARSSISAQVSLGPGILPWAGEMVRRSLLHRTPGGVHDELHRLLSEIEKLDRSVQPNYAQPNHAGAGTNRKGRP